MKFRCPICAKILTLDDLFTGRRLECPGCESTFNPDRIRQFHAQQQLLKTSPTRESIGSETASKSVANRISVTPRDESIEKAGQIASNSPSLILRRRRNFIRYLVGLSILVTLAIGLIFGLIHVLKQSELRDSPTAMSAELSKAESSKVVENEEKTNSNESDKPDPETTDALIATAEVPTANPFQLIDTFDDSFKKPNNTFKSTSSLSDCWFKVRPFLVEVRAETPFGLRFATGTIVDSRGWILTSYRAVAGATRIDIRASRQSVSDESETAPLVDQVRGIIAADSEHDLVILAVNPRFVVAFSDLPIAAVDKLVGSQYLIQCMPPTQSYPWSVVESRIVRRIQLAEMESHAAEEMVRLGFRDGNLRWIQHQQLSPLRVGAPLFNDQCQLVAMNSSAVGETEQDVLAIPASFILQLKHQSLTELQPLPVPQIDAGSNTLSNAQQATHGITDEISTMPVVHSGSSLRELSETINRLGSDCQLFDWWPGTESETRMLGEFATVLVAARSRMVAADDDPNIETLRLQMSDWIEQMIHSLTIGSARGRDAHFDFNRRLATSPILSQAGNRMFVGFAYVEFSAMESPRIAIDQDSAQDSIVFEFDGSDRHVITNLSSEWPPLPPDSRWLIIGERLDGEVRLNGQNQDSILLQKSRVHFVLPADAP